MERCPSIPRDNWQQLCLEDGLKFHTDLDGTTYWKESFAYEITDTMAEAITNATNELHSMCLKVVERVTASDELLREFAIPEAFWEFVRKSWAAQEPTLYGRFDLVCFGRSSVKLLEYNADTPTVIIESGIVQQHWKEQVHPTNGRQLNSLHASMVQTFASLNIQGTLHFACIKNNLEDHCSTQYIMQLAREAGLQDVRFVYMEDFGWLEEDSMFVDLDNVPICCCFKLYPWEWLMNEDFAENILRATDLRWIEPPWKSVLSNKALLPLLWEMFPEHPLLLPAYFERDRGKLEGRRFVRKPILGREGCNISFFAPVASSRTDSVVVTGSKDSSLNPSDTPATSTTDLLSDRDSTDPRSEVVLPETKGMYGEEGYIYQLECPPPVYMDSTNPEKLWKPVVGSWVVGGRAAGIGIREDGSRITSNASHFVPHIVVPTSASALL